MPNTLCFCVFECAGTDMKEMDKNHGKQSKTSTRLEKGKKPKPRKKFIQEKPKMTKVILRDSKNNKRDS